MKRGNVVTAILILLVFITIIMITNEEQIKNKITGKGTTSDEGMSGRGGGSTSSGLSGTSSSGTDAEAYSKSGSISIGEEKFSEGTSIVTKDKVKVGITLTDEKGRELTYVTKGKLIDPEGIIVKTFNITTNENITLKINKTKLGYWSINLTNGTKTKNFLVALSDNEKEILKNTRTVQEGFKKLPNDASLADLLLDLNRKEASLLKNILKPLEQTENPLFSPLKSPEITLEPIDIQKSPTQKKGDDITVQFSMKKPEIEKEDILTISIKENKPLINFNFGF